MKKRLFVYFLLSVWVFPLGGCSEDDSGIVIPPPGPPAYKSLESRDDILFNLEKAYNERNDSQYARVLDESFTFFFSQNDIDDPDIVVPTEWGKGREVTSASNMFNGVAPPGQDPITDIDLDLTFTAGEDQWGREPGSPGNHPGEDWFSKTVTYNMTIQLAGPDVFQSTQILASFLVRFAEVGGDSLWQIVVWRDDVLAGTVRPPLSGAISEKPSWGAIKALFSVSGAPLGSSPLTPSTWGQIKSFF